jgi:sodium transport system ATP-binding protein
MIEAQILVKVFAGTRKRPEVRAVQGISFNCEPGRIYSLLDANGAGKTTTLRMLATILFPTSGTAKVAGFDIVDQPQEVRANVAFFPRRPRSMDA